MPLGTSASGASAEVTRAAASPAARWRATRASTIPTAIPRTPTATPSTTGRARPGAPPRRGRPSWRASRPKPTRRAATQTSPPARREVPLSGTRRAPAGAGRWLTRRRAILRHRPLHRQDQATHQGPSGGEAGGTLLLLCLLHHRPRLRLKEQSGRPDAGLPRRFPRPGTGLPRGRRGRRGVGRRRGLGEGCGGASALQGA